jgi:hypothetical protein
MLWLKARCEAHLMRLRFCTECGVEAQTMNHTSSRAAGAATNQRAGYESEMLASSIKTCVAQSIEIRLASIFSAVAI